MKRGRWIGSLLIAAFACAAPLRGEDVQWQSANDAPRTDSPAAATLGAPALFSPIPKETPGSRYTSPAGELIPVSFEIVAPSAGGPSLPPPVVVSSPGVPSVAVRKTSIPPAAVINSSVPPAAPPHPHPEIIAVSAPVTNSADPSTETQDDQSELLFAVDRSFAGGTARRVQGGSIVPASAGGTIPAAAELPMVPGWDAPKDTSWGAGPPAGPSPFDPDALGIPSVYPLRPRFYASSEYLLWWLQGQSVPVLATTSNPSDFGILGAPSTQILFGGNQINGNSPFSGGRFTLGSWLGCDQNKAVEITGFFLGTRSAGFSTNSSIHPVIGRPFLEANTGLESAQLTALPGVTAGILTVSAPTSLWGLAGNLRCLLCCGCNYRITALAGFRNINLNEGLTVTENVQALPTAPEPFTNQAITVTDSFATQNHFYGGNIGADAIWYWGRWSVDVRGQVALGDTVQMLDISGTQRFVSPTGVVQNFTGGLLALPSNIGHFSHNAFSVVPEIGVNLGYQIMPNLRAYVGYNFLYWSNVIRPGTSIDRALDVTQIPNFPLHPEPAPLPGLHPAPLFHEVGLWAQGLTFGFQFLY